MTNPLGYPLNCPKCGNRLEYVRRDDELHIFLCYNDGVVILPPSGRIYVAASKVLLKH